MRRFFVPGAALALLCVSLVVVFGSGQAMADGLEDLPGWDRYQRMRRAGSLASGGTVRGVRWAEDGGSVSFERDGEWFRVDLQTMAVGPAEREAGGGRQQGRRGRRGGPGRGRQRHTEASPDGAWKAVSRDWNVVACRVS